MNKRLDRDTIMMQRNRDPFARRRFLKKSISAAIGGILGFAMLHAGFAFGGKQKESAKVRPVPKIHPDAVARKTTVR